MNPKKANPGDRIRLGNGQTYRIARVVPALFSYDKWEYELDNGMFLMEYEFTREDVEAQA